MSTNAELEMKIHDVKDRLGMIEYKIQKIADEITRISNNLSNLDSRLKQMKDKTDEL